MSCRPGPTHVGCNKKPDPKTEPVARRPRVFLSRHALTLATRLTSHSPPPRPSPHTVAVACVAAAAAAVGSCSDFLEPLARTRTLPRRTRAATLHLNSGTNLQLIYVNRQRVWVSNQRAAGSGSDCSCGCPGCSSASSGVCIVPLFGPGLRSAIHSAARDFSL